MVECMKNIAKKPQTNADRIRSMTENEAKAVRFIENIKNNAVVTLDNIEKEEPNVSPLVYKGREEKANTILVMVGELQRYRAIGTPEECREAVEKQTAIIKELEEETEWAFNRYIDCPYDNPGYEIYREQYYERKRCLEIVKGGVVGGS